MVFVYLYVCIYLYVFIIFMYFVIDDYFRVVLELFFNDLNLDYINVNFVDVSIEI